MIRSRWQIVVFFSLAANGALLAAEPAKKPPAKPQPLMIEVIQSTGETNAGQILSCDSRMLKLQDKNKKTARIWLANIIAIYPTFTAAEQKQLAGMQSITREVAMGNLLLKRGLDPLAELVFAQVVQEEKTLAKDIASLYEKNDIKQPTWLSQEQTPLDQRRYILPTVKQVQANLKRAKAWGDKMKEIAPKTHLLETDHFLIYSAWAPSDDAKLKQIYERLYGTLCKQFDIPPHENIWIGKMPVYAFWEKPHYVSFCVGVANTSMLIAQRSAGFAGVQGDFRYVCLGPVIIEGMSKRRAQSWFFELLTHESTHAFLSRYISERHISSWLNEGIAETIASSLVPGSNAEYKLKTAHTAIKHNRVPISELLPIFIADHIPLEGFYYGAAQSITRFLIQKDRKKFIRMVQLMKEGKSDEEALKEAYGMSFQSLLNEWLKAVR